MSVAHTGMGMGLKSRRVPRGASHNGGRKAARNVSRRPGGARIRPGRAVVLAFWALVAAAFFTAVSVGLLYGFRWLTTNPFFALTSIEVRGVEHLTVAEVTGRSGASLGGNVLDLSVSEVESRLAADPWIESAAVKRILPGSLRIVVRERVPAWWMMDDSGLFYADAQGRPFAPVEADRFQSMPQLEVSHGTDPVDALARAASLSGAGLPLELADAAWVRVLPGGGMEWAFDGMGLTVRVDPGARGWDESLARLAVAWRDLERRKEMAAVRSLRVSGGKVWARLAER